MQFNSHTFYDEDGSTKPKYRRRSPQDGGAEVELDGGRKVDNRWVIPYNPYFTSR